MSSRRYAIHIPPVQHLNGKLASSSVVCHNQPDTSESVNTYYYGYRHQDSEVSRYALRERARNLSEKPYHEVELADMQLFSECVTTAQSLLSDATELRKIRRAFAGQSRYKRIWNYTIAELIKHKGQAPW